jgi:hypothetical protein
LALHHAVNQLPADNGERDTANTPIHETYLPEPDAQAFYTVNPHSLDRILDLGNQMPSATSGGGHFSPPV